MNPFLFTVFVSKRSDLIRSLKSILLFFILIQSLSAQVYPKFLYLVAQKETRKHSQIVKNLTYIKKNSPSKGSKPWVEMN